MARLLLHGRGKRFPQTLLRIPRVLVFVLLGALAALAAALIAYVDPSEWTE